MLLYGPRRIRYACHGFSLVELLVALLLGVVLSGGMVAAFIGARQNASYEDQLARMQENGRFALRLLTRELVMAGFFAGAPNLSAVTPEALGTDCGEGAWALDSSTPLDFVSDPPGGNVPVSVAGTSLDCLRSGDLRAGADILTVKRTAGEPSLSGADLAAGLTTSSVEGWYLQLESGKPTGWIRLAPADLPLLASDLSAYSYWRAITKVLFIRGYSDSDNREDGIPTLCMETLSGNAMAARCLVEGIEDMQYEFGIDTDSDGVPDRYSNSPTAAQLLNAITVKVHLLVRSIRAVPGWVDEKSYSLGRKVVTARRDGYLRRVFSATVLLRNLGKPA